MPSALLIEDDSRIAQLLMLELGHAGWGVSWQNTGRSGIERARKGRHDLVILDLMLPDLDGLAVCRGIRESADIPILILTARDAVPDRVLGLDAGADDYLVKPFATTELLARMRALTRRQKTRTDDEDDWLTAGTLKLSPLRHEARLQGGPVELTPREFALLSYFLENAGITLTRQMILDRVWGWGYTGSSSIVDVYVGYLRHKIDWSQGGCQLLTVWGIGYVLKEDEP